MKVIKPLNYNNLFILIVIVACLPNLLIAQNLDLLWAKSTESSSSSSGAEGKANTVDGAGNIYTVGNFRGTVDFDPSINSYELTSENTEDLFIMKSNSAGNLSWVVQIDANINYSTVFDIIVDNTGNPIITGQFAGDVDFDPSSGTFILNGFSFNFFLLKLSSSGNFVWAKNFQNGSFAYSGGYSLDKDPSGNIYSTGYYDGFDLDFDPGPSVYNLPNTSQTAIFVSKFDSNGNFIWAKSVDGANGNDLGQGIKVDNVGSVLISGYFQGTADFDPGAGNSNLTPLGSADAFLLKLDGSGFFLWAKQFGGSSGSISEAFVETTTTAILLTANFAGTIDIDPGPGVNNVSATGILGLFLSNLSTAGSFNWGNKLESTETVIVSTISSSANSDILISGYFRNTVDFDPGPATTNLTSFGYDDIFILNLSQNGNFNNVARLGGPDVDIARNSDLDLDNNVFITGLYGGISDFDPSPGAYNLNAHDSYECFVGKYGEGSSCQPVNITTQPGDQVVIEGNTCTFTIITSGDTPITYQWRKNGVNISNAINSTYITPPLNQSNDGDVYTCYVSNCSGTFNITSNEATITVVSSCAQPSIQSSNINFSSITQTQMTLEWSNGDGTRRIVKINTTNNFTAPLNGSDPMEDSHYNLSSGEQVIYNGTSDFVTVTGLSPNTTYWFRIYEANCSGNNSIYLTTNAFGNPKSQMTSTDGPVIGNVTYTNVIQYHFWIPEQYTLYSGPISQTRPLKVCADGTLATYIKIAATPPQNINFQILDQDGTIVSDAISQNHTNPELNGKLGPLNIFGNNVEVSYTAPEFMNLFGSFFKPMSIRILHNGTPIPGATFPLRIYRAPILFVHGLWGAGSSFEKMEDIFFDEAFQDYDLMRKVDYSSNFDNSRSFNENNAVVPGGIEELYYLIRTKGYSASEIDIIAHSMGGLLTRRYLQGSGYQKDINKIITIDSPFGGTQSANFLLNRRNEKTRDLLATLNNYCGLGAVDNLRANSPQIAALQSGHQHHHNVPIYVINSTTSFDEAGTLDGNWDKLLIRMAWFYNSPFYILHGLTSPQKLAEYIYFNEIGDLVVPKSSQIGATPLTNDPIPIFTDVHTRTKDNYAVIEFVKNKLAINPNNSTEFWRNGFGNMPQLPIRNNNIIPDNYPYPNYSSITDSVLILSPNKDDSLNSGDIINISAAGTDGIVRMMIISGPKEGPFIIDIKDSNFISYTYLIPQDFTGELFTYCAGLDSTGLLFEDTVLVTVTPNAILDSIIIDPQMISVGTGFLSSFKVIGYYNDSVARNITGFDSLKYTIADSNLVVLSSENSVKGIAAGNSVLKANYQNLSDSIIINVYTKTINGSASFNVNINTLCQNDSISFYNKSSGNPDSLLWNFESGIPESTNILNPIVHYENPGDFGINLIAYFPTYNDTFSLENYIKVYPSAISSILISGFTTFCEGDSATLTANSSEVYDWNNGSNDQEIIVTEEGVYALTITDINGCKASSESIFINVLQNPAPAVSPPGTNTICVGDSLNLISDAAQNYLWNNADTTQSIVVSMPGEYFVQVIDSNGCTGTSLPVIVAFADTIQTILTVSGPASPCFGDTLLLTGFPSYSYSWNTGESSPTITVTNSGEYFATIADSFGCTMPSDTLFVLIHDLPVVDLGPDTIETSNAVILDAGNSGSFFVWNTGAMSQTINVSITGYYSVEVLDQNGCIGSDSVYMNFTTSTGHIEGTNQFQIIPNPNDGRFYLSCNTVITEELETRIIDPLGQVLFENKILFGPGQFSTQIDISGKYRGIAFAVIRIGDKIEVLKLVIE